MTEQERLTMAMYKCKNELSFFTRYFFKHETGNQLIIKKHHELIWAALEKVLNGETTRLIINIAPRFGKTEIAVKKFIAYGLALNPSAKFMHLSYADTLALDNSAAVRDLVQQPYYKELFPYVQLKSDSNSKKKWYTTKGGLVYATAAGGQVTGFGAGKKDSEATEDYEDEFFGYEKKESIFEGAIIYDDPNKPEDSKSKVALDIVNNRFDTTIINRANSAKTPIIVIMQRIDENDLTGHIIKNDFKNEWTVLSIPALQVDELGVEYSLWEKTISIESLQHLRETRRDYFERQYMQNPQPIEGRLYEEFQTYVEKPITQKNRKLNYTDVADKGKDYLCSICYDETEQGNYVTDIVYTKANTANSEPLVVNMLTRNKTQRAKIESNSAGSVFARNIRNQLRIAGNNNTYVDEFTQQGNKETRILLNRNEVNNSIIFPYNWATKWPVFYEHVVNYTAEGKNQYDDAVDVLTGIVESVKKGSSLISFFNANKNR